MVSAEDESLALIERALDQMGEVIAAIRPDQAMLPTPCAGWDVRSLVSHVVGQNLRNFAVAARGEAADWQTPPEELGEDWSAAFRDGARLLLETWRREDLDRLVTVPGGGQAPLRSRADHQVTELAVHTWDLARATGQPRDLDPGVADRALAWSRGMLRPEFRGPDKAFGPEVPVPESAPVYDRLAGWFGRNPQWTPRA